MIQKDRSLREHLGNSQTSRKLLILIILNLVFFMVEFIYGIQSGSLSLLSDSLHMLFDLLALIIAFISDYLQTQSPNAYYHYGYDRVKVMSGYVNMILLIALICYVIIESLERMIVKVNVDGTGIFWVAVLGFIINLIGLIFFHEYHHIGSSKKCNHNGNHSCNDNHNDNHNHNQNHNENDEHNNENIQGLYLHILADTLGSVGVIVSSILITYYPSPYIDPICSLLISILILVSTIPLFKSTYYTFMQSVPPNLRQKQKQLRQIINKMDEVLSINQINLWAMDADLLKGAISLRIKDKVDYQFVRQKVRSHADKLGDIDLFVQLEKGLTSI